MYSLITAPSRPTVETKYPLARVLPHKIAFPLAIDASKVDRPLALDEPYHLRDPVFDTRVPTPTIPYKSITGSAPSIRRRWLRVL
jgi:hypothetical protein